MKSPSQFIHQFLDSGLWSLRMPSWGGDERLNTELRANGDHIPVLGTLMQEMWYSDGGSHDWSTKRRVELTAIPSHGPNVSFDDLLDPDGIGTSMADLIPELRARCRALGLGECAVTHADRSVRSEPRDEGEIYTDAQWAVAYIPAAQWEQIPLAQRPTIYADSVKGDLPNNVEHVSRIVFPQERHVPMDRPPEPRPIDFDTARVLFESSDHAARQQVFLTGDGTRLIDIMAPHWTALWYRVHEEVFTRQFGCAPETLPAGHMAHCIADICKGISTERYKMDGRAKRRIMNDGLAALFGSSLFPSQELLRSRRRCRAEYQFRYEDLDIPDVQEYERHLLPEILRHPKFAFTEKDVHLPEAHERARRLLPEILLNPGCVILRDAE